MAEKEPCRNAPACPRSMATRNGEPAYKGFCARCYKEDVEARRGGAPGAAPKVVLPKREVKDPMDAPGAQVHSNNNIVQTNKLSWCIDGHHPGVEKPEDLVEGPSFGYWKTCPATKTLGDGRTLTCGCACHAE